MNLPGSHSEEVANLVYSVAFTLCSVEKLSVCLLDLMPTQVVHPVDSVELFSNIIILSGGRKCPFIKKNTITITITIVDFSLVS